MPQIADWEYALTRKLLKTAQQFASLPGVPPLPADLEQWPTGNPAWNATLLSELLDLAKGYEKDIGQKTFRLAHPHFPDMDPQQLSDAIRHDLHYRLSRLDPERVPVFFYQLSGPERTWGEWYRTTMAMDRWFEQHPGAYRTPLAAFIPGPAFEGSAGFTLAWPALRARPVLPDLFGPIPQALVFVNNRESGQFMEVLPHEYAHVINPSIGLKDPEMRSILDEAVGMGTLATLLPHLAERRHVDPNSTLEAILTGHDFASQVAKSRWYLDILLKALKLKSVPGVEDKNYVQRVLEPADPYVPPGNDPWWQTMDAQRRQTLEDRTAGTLASDAETLTKALAYVIAYDRLKQKFPDLSKVTYADLLNTLREMRNNRETKPLFDLVYFGPSSPQDVYKAIQPILEKHPELKESPYVRTIEALRTSQNLFRYTQEGSGEKQPEATGQTMKKPSEAKNTPQQNQPANTPHKTSGKKDESSAQSKDGKSAKRDGKTL